MSAARHSACPSRYRLRSQSGFLRDLESPNRFLPAGAQPGRSLVAGAQSPPETERGQRRRNGLGESSRSSARSQTKPLAPRCHEESDNNHDEEKERLDGRKSRELSLSAD